ncbi:hypothetical protein K450DRAFT_230388 [Umbelopsis ramanniana AG]|uniref:SH3 domain-containing protein n=1 Tax=Umbelopsis ramanniana AG TaxID=1314678 RepID=A0AAD5EES5_UMBRA|nr:uncharacterized protein K450DRAFT_230388 [Umbelopsis ramanniana AG]KAI8582012.1 hypothetical protein K450DRAFT_230388 [Umbelopsis ramanniana AG]
MTPNSTHNESSLSFVDSFWGKELNGIDTLFRRMESGHQTCENLYAIYMGRAKVEADYSNHLSVISRTVLCDEGETGDIVRALDVFSNEMATNGQSHLELARKIESDIAGPLQNFSQNYIDLVSECRNRIDELCDTRDRFAAVIVETGDRFTAEQKRLGADRNSRASRFAQERLREIQYQSAIANFEGSVKELHDIWGDCCTVLQDLEEQRIELLILKMWEYANLYSANLLSEDDTYESIRQSLDKCKIQDEIETFISEKATGREVPAPLDYLQKYVQHNGKGREVEEIPEPQLPVNKTLPPRPDRAPTVTKKTLAKIQTNSVRQQPTVAKELPGFGSNKRMDIRRKPVSSTSSPMKSSPPTRNDNDMVMASSQSEDSLRSKSKPIGELEELLKRFEGGNEQPQEAPRKNRSNHSVRQGGTPPMPPPRPHEKYRQSMVVESDYSEKKNQVKTADRRQSAPPPSNTQSRSLTPTSSSSTDILSPPKSPRPQSQQLSPRLPDAEVPVEPITPPLSASSTEMCPSPVFLQQAYHPPQENDEWKVSSSPSPIEQEHQQRQQLQQHQQMQQQQQQQQQQQVQQQMQQQHHQQHLLSQQSQSTSHLPQQQQQQPTHGQHSIQQSQQQQHVAQSQHMMPQQQQQPIQGQPLMHQSQQQQQMAVPYANQGQQYMRSQTLPANYGGSSPMMAPRSPMMRSPMIQPRSPMIQNGAVSPMMQAASAPRPTTLPNGRPILQWAVAKYDYAARDKTELSFRKGSVMAILGPSEDEDWWLADLWDEQNRCSYGHGTVPSNYVQTL